VDVAEHPKPVLNRSTVHFEIDWEPTSFEFFPLHPALFSCSVALQEMTFFFLLLMFFTKMAFDETAFSRGYEDFWNLD
jgi:hypothetical protein